MSTLPVNPIDEDFSLDLSLFSITFSMPSKAPDNINKTLVVSNFIVPVLVFISKTPPSTIFKRLC